MNITVDLQFLVNLAGIEAGTFYDDDHDPEYVPYNAWMDFGGWEHFKGEASRFILCDYVEKLTPYLSEDDISSIENCGDYWYEDLLGNIPEDLYYEIDKAVEDLYKKAYEEFQKFENEFKHDFWNIERELESEEIAKQNEIIIAEYGCPDWAETPDYRSLSFFMESFAAENYAHPALIMNSIQNDIDLYEEEFVDWTTTNGKHFVKTSRDRILCLEEYV